MSKKPIEQEICLIVAGIIGDYNNGRDIDTVNLFNQPDQEAIIDITHKLQRILFPGYFRDKNYKLYSINNSVATLTEDVVYNLNKQILRVLKYREDCSGMNAAELSDKAEELTLAFLKTIPKVRALLDTDLAAFYDGDPAATCKDEIIFAYPGLRAISIQRLAHELYQLNVPIIPRIMTEHAHSETGIDIHPGATIGEYFFIDHGTGIVVGETTVIGKNVKLYQGVTLGALSTRGGQKLRNKRRHPTIEDNVTIYSGASILGGDTIVGHDSVIGGNTFITESVRPGSRVAAKAQELVYSSSGIASSNERVDQNWMDMDQDASLNFGAYI
ncbi:MAG: serine acetyltransferase [Eubacteriales bacterium]|nr:serine acetyltransferase [Eubacteriales bacterium]